jgi:thiol-disulfide isomerase/thioredoxin
VRRYTSVLWLAAIAAVGVVLAVLAFVPLRPSGELRDDPLVGRAAPAIEAHGLDGRDWSLTADGAGRVTWINFWATSCEPCRSEMPAMQALAEAYGDRLLILGVNWGEAQDAVSSFAERYGVHYPLLLDPRLENYFRWARTDGLPRHFFVSPNGEVVREVIGPLEPGRMVSILRELIGPA